MSDIAPISDDELDRLARLEQMMVLDLIPEQLFDEITKLAAEICELPVALVNLVDESQQWFKTNSGLSISRETYRNLPFCAHTILADNLLEVPDTALDNRFKEDQIVSESPHIRFYAGVPILLPDNIKAGTLCVLGFQPNLLNNHQKTVLVGLAGLTAQALLLRSAAIREMQTKASKLAAIVEYSEDAIISKTLDGIVATWNHSAEKMFGYSAGEMFGKPITKLFPKSRMAEEELFLAKIKNNEHISHYETERLHKNGETLHVSVSLSPIKNVTGEIIGISKVIHDISENQKLRQTASEAFIKLSRLAEIVKSSDDAIISKTLDGIVLSWNAAAEKLFGYKAEEMIGQPIIKLFPEDRLDEEAMFIKQLKNVAQIKHFETERLNKNGDLISVSVSLSPIRDERGKIVAISKIARDITEHRKMQRVLAEEHERIKVTMDCIGDAVITTDKNGLIQYLNPVAEKLTGWTVDEAQGRLLHQVFNIVNEATRLPCINPVEICILEDRTVGLANQTMLIDRGGKVYGIEDSAAPIRDAEGKTLGVVLVFHDVTLQRQLANEMSYRATHDLLTGLVNRGEFEFILEGIMSNHRESNLEHTLLYIDLDQFKIINDTCGHAAGDLLLKEVAKIMETCVRTTDILSRTGGDEFAIILKRCDAGAGLKVANQICKAVDEYRFDYDTQRFHIGASIGMVVIDRQWSSITTLLQAADNACYAAKNTGRNRVHVHYDDDNDMEFRRGEVKWASRIEHALEEKNFELYCQRIIPLNKDAGYHGEVLIRMRDGRGGLVLPGAFLPAADRFHMTSRIDRWVITEVFEWLSIHKTEINHVEKISVNLSGQSLGDPNFHSFVLESIKLLSPNCKKLCFEITETVAIKNIAEATRFIESMKNYGIQFSLDDFGSGVSSFGYLKNLSVDYLKIDGQFIHGLLDSPIDQATVRCIVEIAKATGKHTIAEWVETEEEEKMLAAMGVDYIQGYLRHRPAPLDQFLETKTIVN